MTSGPLGGLRVLDAASLYAAPLIASLLADHGADVVRLEPPGGDPYRRFPAGLWALTGRNKRSLVLDLDTPEDRSRLHRIIPALDVVVVNEPAHRLRRRGLDPQTLAELNSALVVVHVSGYGMDGPYADRPGNGTLAEAFSGLTHMTGDPDGEPVLPSVPLGDAVTAWAGAFGVLAACYQRKANGGPGQVIDVNPVEAMLHVVAPMFTAYGEGGDPPGRRASGMAGSPLRGVFATRDKRWVAVSISTPRQLDALSALVGHQPPEAIETALRSWSVRRSQEDVLAQLVGVRVPAAPVNDAADVLADPHIQARAAIRTVQSSDLGPTRVPAPAPRMRSAGGPATGRLPEIGEHTEEILRQWGGDDDRRA